MVLGRVPRLCRPSLRWWGWRAASPWCWSSLRAVMAITVTSCTSSRQATTWRGVMPIKGPLTPLLAHVMDVVAPGSLTVLRLPSALMAGATVFVTGLIAFELGARRRAQTIAASCAAVASVLLVVGHLLSTSTFDLLAWSVVTWLVARVIRTRDERLWLLAGVVAGIALLNKPLIAFLLAGLGVGLVTAGPRRLLRSGWLWAGLGIAALLWSPWLIWQASHGWPQLDVSSSIAAGGSASSQPRWALLPFQFLLVSPVLAPVWIAGLVALLLRQRLRPFRLFPVAWLFLVVAFRHRRQALLPRGPVPGPVGGRRDRDRRLAHTRLNLLARHLALEHDRPQRPRCRRSSRCRSYPSGTVPGDRRERRRRRDDRLARPHADRRERLSPSGLGHRHLYVELRRSRARSTVTGRRLACPGRTAGTTRSATGARHRIVSVPWSRWVSTPRSCSTSEAAGSQVAFTRWGSRSVPCGAR